MTHTRKIKIIIEAELHEREPNPSGQPSADADPTEYGYEQSLFAALRADPERYNAFVNTRVIEELEGLGIHNLIPTLAQIDDTFCALSQYILIFNNFRQQSPT